MTLTARVLATIRRHNLIPAGTRVLVAVSGGADSVALALALVRVAPVHGFTVAGIAHLNHGLRRDDARGDEEFVAAFAARLGLPCVVERADVAALAAQDRESIEAAARRARYAFLDRAARQLGADGIATGHTADDQAETLLLRLMRGAGIDALRGIRARNGAVIRPLLDARRADVEAFLRDEHQAWREDASNVDRAIARNRVRHDVMPVLAAAAGHDVTAALARTAALIEDDAEELDRRAIETSARAVLRAGGLKPAPAGILLDIGMLTDAGPAIARRVLRAQLARLAGGRFLSLEHVEAVRSLMKEGSPSRVQIPGVMAARNRDRLRLEVFEVPEGIDADETEVVSFETALDVPGIAEVQAGAMIVSAEIGPVEAADLKKMEARGDAVALQGLDGARLTVRSRRPGDALRPLGAPGRRKLQDVFVDRKVAREERDRVPLVVDDRGRIIWVVGHTIADEFRVTAPAPRVLLLKVRRVVGGPV